LTELRSPSASSSLQTPLLFSCDGYVSARIGVEQVGEAEPARASRSVAMKVTHDIITSPVFRLLSTHEIDLDLGEHKLPLRIELFQSEENDTVFRARLWQTELFRLKPTIPTSEEDPYCDDLLLLQRSLGKESFDYGFFSAYDPRDALELVLKDLSRFLEHLSGQAASVQGVD
jgi:hypothetical protein